MKGDERIPGDGDFVMNILSEAYEIESGLFFINNVNAAEANAARAIMAAKSCAWLKKMIPLNTN